MQRLAEGAVIEAAGPYGQFVYPQHERPAVFIAGGIGITPFRSMLVDLASRQLDPDITLLYANSTPAIPFQRLFDDLAAKRSRLKVIYSVGQPNAAWKGRVGRIDEALIREHVPAPTSRCFTSRGQNPWSKPQRRPCSTSAAGRSGSSKTSSQATSRDPAVPPRSALWRIDERLWWGTMSEGVDRC